MQVLEATKLARKIIRAEFPENANLDIWTNKYKTCRTVKCYASDTRLVNRITKEVTSLIPEATVVLRQPIFKYGRPALIIRIPNN